MNFRLLGLQTHVKNNVRANSIKQIGFIAACAVEKKIYKYIVPLWI